jgi:putative membrane protein
MFSGLFGLSTLLTGMNSSSGSYAQDLDADIKMDDKGLWRSSFMGAIGGLLVGLLPAMSPSQMGIVFQELKAVKKRTKKVLEDVKIREFMPMVGSLHTADAMFSIFGLYLMNNPRSGISVILQDLFGQIDLGLLLLLSFVMLITGFIAYKLHIAIGKVFAVFASRVDFRIMSGLGFTFVIGMVFTMTGYLGIIIAIVSMSVGLIPALVGVSRTHCMGCLLLPTLLFFLGL